MIVVSSILRRGVYPVMSRTGMFSGRTNDGDVYVLTYHGVQSRGFKAGASPIDGTQVSADKFRQQLRFLKSRYQLISPEDFRRWCKGETSLPAGAVLLTCDDGFVNVLSEMVPILREEGLRCLFFVTGESLKEEPSYLWYEELYQMLAYATNGDATTRWQELLSRYSEMSAEGRCNAMTALRQSLGLAPNWPNGSGGSAEERGYLLLNRKQLCALKAEGMTVGAHTLSHMRLSAMSCETASREIHEIRPRLEKHIGEEVWALAYPFGDLASAGEREMKMAEDAGYTCAFYNEGAGCVRRTSSRFALSRTHITSEMNLPEFEAHLSGFHDELRRRIRGSRR
jgi:peptidoglycan/xylan/chitin deacetylase (PgdA/CDA1 family)